MKPRDDGAALNVALFASRRPTPAAMFSSTNVGPGDASPQDSPISPRSGAPIQLPAEATRRGPAGRPLPQPRSKSTSISLTSRSIAGNLDTPSRRESALGEISSNAISTLLQPPIVRTGLVPTSAAAAAASGYRAPTNREIPPVTLTNVPRIPLDGFREYLSRIGPLFENVQRARSTAEQAAWLEKDKELEKTDRLGAALDSRMSRGDAQTPVTPRTGAPSTLSPIGAPGEQRRRSSAGLRKNRNEPTPLSIIPNVYFDEDFRLENPRTFDVVSEHAEIVRPAVGKSTEQKEANEFPQQPRKPLATNGILQEKLSWYMDTVEVHLINSISAASTGFFAALGSLRELQSEAEESVKKIQSLREDLRKLDQEVAVGGLEIAAKRRRRVNLAKLSQATAQVQSVVENVKKADALVDESDFDEAANQIDRVGKLVCGIEEPDHEGAQLIDLRPLKALQGLDAGLQELQLRIGAGFTDRFTSVLMDDVRHHKAKVRSTDTIKRWSRQPGVTRAYMETSDQFRADLLAALKGLQKAGSMAPATTAYREAVTREMKNIIKTHLPSSNDEDADSMVSTSTRGGFKLSQQEKSSILARNLRALDAEDAEQLLVRVYTSVSEGLRRISTQTKVLLDLTSSMQPLEAGSLSPKSGPSKTVDLLTAERQLSSGAESTIQRPAAQEQLAETLDMSSLLGQAVDTVQSQITRVLKVRNEQTTRLPKLWFLRYFTLNRLFADECEAISGRGGQALKGVVNAQISGFVQALAASETERIAALLDQDSWNAQDFGENGNALLQRVLAAINSDPPEWTRETPLWEDASSLQAVTQTNGEIKTANGRPVLDQQPAPVKANTAKPAYIDETRYVLVASAVALLPTLDSFLALTASLSSMTPQISTALLDVLRTFNSRSCQLILGAGATRSAGLKNITTKHLALASQALSFIIALVPYVREAVRRHLPPSQPQVLAEFDKTKRLYQEHQAGIHDKLVEIMTTRSQTHVKTLLSSDLSSSAASPSPYMETLTKETLTLHRVLSRHLSELDVGIIARQIAAAYKSQWTNAFTEVALNDQKSEQCLLKDAEAFQGRLGKIEQFEDATSDVLGVVKARIDDDKTTEDPAQSEAGDSKGES